MGKDYNVDNLIQKGETITVNLDDGLVQQFGNFKISALSTNLLAFDMQEDGKSFIARERNGNEQGRGLDKGQVKQPTPTPPDNKIVLKLLPSSIISNNSLITLS